MTVEAVVRVLADCAGVEDDDVHLAELRVCGWIRSCVPGGVQQPGEPLGIVDVHLAAERAHLVGAAAACHGLLSHRVSTVRRLRSDRAAQAR